MSSHESHAFSATRAFLSPRGDRANRARKWYQWHDPGMSKAERRLVSKLDFFILLYTCLTFFVKYLDQTNVTNAYLGGMDKDLKLVGTDALNWFTTYFSIGVIIGAPFSTCMLTVVHPRFWLPACTILWSFCVLFMYKAQNVETIYGLRFACGLFEAGAYPGAFYIIGSWYTRSEISRRTGIFLYASLVGGMCSSFIQAGLYRNMDGHLGLRAWRWLFIFDFCLGIPVAIFGFFTCPNEPKSKKMWWMTEEERELAIKRMRDDGRDSDGKWDWTVIKRILRSWQFYTFVVAWGFVELTCGNNLQRWMGLWLQHIGWKNPGLQIPPALHGFVAMAWVFLSSTAADVLDNRALPMAAMAIVQLLCYVVFLVGSTNYSLRFAAYYLASSYNSLSPLLASWLNCSCGGDKQLRSFISAFMISVGYAIEAPAQQTLFPTHDAPYFLKSHGYAFGVAMIACTIVWNSALMPIIKAKFGKKDACCTDRCEPPSEGTDGDVAERVYGTIKTKDDGASH